MFQSTAWLIQNRNIRNRIVNNITIVSKYDININFIKCIQSLYTRKELQGLRWKPKNLNRKIHSTATDNKRNTVSKTFLLLKFK